VSGSIHLIVEGESDPEVVRALLKAKKINVRVQPLFPTGGGIGISRLAGQLDRLIRTAIQKRESGDCIAVLHDADEQVPQSHRDDYDQIKNICQQYRQDLVLVIAKDEIESWLLADEGLCKWLDVKPKNCDHESKPSERLNSLVKRKTGKDYTGRTRAQVLGHLDGSGDKLSQSMDDAMKHLQNAPCVQDS